MRTSWTKNYFISKILFFDIFNTITFIVNNSKTTSEQFVNKARSNGFIGLEPHKEDPNNGSRISLYNAITIEDIYSLIKFMDLFQNVIINNHPYAFD